MTAFITSGLAGTLSGIDIATATRHSLPGWRGQRSKKFASRKNRSVIASNSFLEVACCLEFEHQPDVASYETRLFTLHFLESHHCYTPQFLVNAVYGSQLLLEIKNDLRLQDNTLNARLSNYAEWLAGQGCTLKWLAASSFLHRVRAENLWFLYQRAFFSTGETSAELVNWMESHGPTTTISDLLSRRFSPKAMAHSIFYGPIDIDLLRPITVSTMVRSKDQP